ncbi:hypothetical protein [Xenorhabdus hominickii]|uniref:Uncharacterized protein n=1 Tax=Xenorhabdus hominickii TaxID=351679 RepID=A0A2G0Q8F3_XENHO|nr:hypothetical protein [Xenorhabdus hominickii]AOM41245.1 hypothetical protein A9255_12020 [Xenorhabdus hominickii]PHM55503.1 hypothetical protein Xhom_02246 [Xenorhabdus hominickii]PHM57132.1 hypothetical protein Xhom_00089 [Xenorhabdus hominickii]
MIENILNDAIKHARHIFQAKTTNKTYINIERLPENKRVMYTPQRIREKENIHNEFVNTCRGIRNIIDKYKYVVSESDAGKVLIGNCGELSAAVFGYLLNHHANNILNWFMTSGKRNVNNAKMPIYIFIITFNDPYDHGLVVVMLPEKAQDLPELNKVYGALPDNAWVCDPWANIACSSKEYNTRWKVKMLRWHLVGKSTSVYQHENLNPPPSPMRQANYHAVTLSQKKVLCIGMIFPDGQVKITHP